MSEHLTDATELLQLLTDSENRNIALTAERDRLKVLAHRAYPDLKASGLCSRHHSVDAVVECQTCYPDLWSLIRHHCQVKQNAFDERDKYRDALAEHTSWKPDVGIIPPIPMGHGTCCCCRKCGRDHDECVCTHNEIEQLLARQVKAELEGN